MSGSALAYIPRIRAYYKALGYGKPYEWAQMDDVPFARLNTPLKRRADRVGDDCCALQDGGGRSGAGRAAQWFGEVF